jgi:hypothetical protein
MPSGVVNGDSLVSSSQLSSLQRLSLPFLCFGGFSALSFPPVDFRRTVYPMRRRGAFSIILSVFVFHGIAGRTIGVRAAAAHQHDAHVVRTRDSFSTNFPSTPGKSWCLDGACVGCVSHLQKQVHLPDATGYRCCTNVRLRSDTSRRTAQSVLPCFFAVRPGGDPL